MEISSIISVALAIVTIIGSLATARHTIRKDRREQEIAHMATVEADDRASDRIVKLAETEAEKRVAVVKTEMQLEINQLKLEYTQEISGLKDRLIDFGRERERYYCYAAPTCAERCERQTEIIGGTD